jgi:8-amino-7-oxononanoate synthase
MLDHLLEKKLRERNSYGLLRKLTVKPGLVDFTSNDYLGLASSADLFRRINDRTEQLGLCRNGAGGSRLLSGNTTYAESLEGMLASIFKAEAALLFNSGYSANLGVLSSLPQRNDTIIYDELAHACIKDGARLSLAKRLNFKHNDLNDLESKMKKSSGHIFVAVESIYSMDGDECPLAGLISLSEKYDATIILDEAHSTGVKGEHGSGLAVSLGLEQKIHVRIYTFGKAVGVHGACVVGSRVLQQFLVNFARPFIYTTAMPAHSLVAIECAFEYLKENKQLQTILSEKIQLYLDRVRGLTNRTASLSSVQNLLIGENTKTRQAALTLEANGFDVRPILSPTVPSGSERIRICLHTFNTEPQIEQLAAQLTMISLQETIV